MARGWIQSKLTDGWSRTEDTLKRIKERAYTTPLARIARQGLDKLRAVTPKLTGATAEGWFSDVVDNIKSIDIDFSNVNIHNGFNVVRGLVEGHGTGTGGWVAGNDFINPASEEMMTELADSVWKEVTNG